MKCSNLVDSWRWFGDSDPVSLKNIKMTGVSNIVSGLHHIPIGEVWTNEEILIHKKKIESHGLSWTVVESIPIHESIKYGGVERDFFINNYIESIKNISSAGINILCYNFMPLVDWTRTDLMSPNPDGSYCLSFDYLDFIVFDLFILERNPAFNYTEEQVLLAKKKFNSMSSSELSRISNTILQGLPGSMVNPSDLTSFKKKLNYYQGKNKLDLQNNLKYFLSLIIPEAIKYNVYLGIHPDDPPIDLFNVPRIVSTLDDLQQICNFFPCEHNGITLCVGSLASNNSNNINEIVSKLSNKVNFLHLRNVTTRTRDNQIFSFRESSHLKGDIDFVSVIQKIIKQPRPIEIYFRPDHGDLLFEDKNEQPSNPGYSLIGRFRGLSEIRGILYCLQRI